MEKAYHFGLAGRGARVHGCCGPSHPPIAVLLCTLFADCFTDRVDCRLRGSSLRSKVEFGFKFEFNARAGRVFGGGPHPSSTLTPLSRVVAFAPVPTHHQGASSGVSVPPRRVL